MVLKHRIRATQAHFNQLPSGSKFVVGISDPNRLQERCIEVGFKFPFELGSSLLPAARFGRSSRVNAEGWVEKHKDRPKETAYRTVVWTWQMKRGYSMETESKLVDVPYKRYPRTFHAPFGMELTVTSTASGGLVLALPMMTLGATPDLQISTGINMLVEIFGECEVFTESLESILAVPITRLNWDVLPVGETPWDVLNEKLKPAYANKGPKVREVVTGRLKTINAYKPSFCAIGRQGFTGYVVFGFPERGFYVLESIRFGNATYGLGEDWKVLSQRTKGELLRANLHKFRVIHSANWESQIRSIFQTRRAA